MPPALPEIVTYFIGYYIFLPGGRFGGGGFRSIAAAEKQLRKRNVPPLSHVRVAFYERAAYLAAYGFTGFWYPPCYAPGHLGGGR